MISRGWLSSGLAALMVMAMAAGAAAQSDKVHKTTLQEQPFPPAPLHTVTVRTLVDQGGLVAPHTHPGAEMAYIVQGRATVTIAGAAPQTLSAGGSFAVPPQTVHSVRNVGDGTLVMVSTYVVDQTKPIASPAP